MEIYNFIITHTYTHTNKQTHTLLLMELIVVAVYHSSGDTKNRPLSEMHEVTTNKELYVTQCKSIFTITLNTNMYVHVCQSSLTINSFVCKKSNNV